MSDLWYCPRVSCERQETFSKPADNLCPGLLMNTGQKYKLLNSTSYVCWSQVVGVYSRRICVLELSQTAVTRKV